MSYSLEFDDGSEEIEVASSRGWPEFSAWASVLPDADYPDLIHLCNFGWVQGPYEVSGQIEHALAASPPRRSVAQTAAGIVEALKGRDEDATVMVVSTLGDPDEDGDKGDDIEESESKDDPTPDDHAQALAVVFAAAPELAPAFRAGKLSDDEKRALCHAVSGHAAGKLRETAESLTAELSPDGKICLPMVDTKGVGDAIGNFFKSALGTIRTAALAATLALKGPDPLTPANREVLAAQVVKQEVYLKGFEKAVRDGSQGPDGIPARAELYGAATWSVAHEVIRSDALASGKVEESNILAVSEHCEECPAETAKGWVPVGDLIPVGQRDCGPRCRCSYSFR